MPLRSKCQFEYVGSALEDVLAGVKVQGVAHVYRCRNCPCLYATTITDRIVYAYTPYDRPTCDYPETGLRGDA